MKTPIVESGIPMPRHHSIKYPWAEMQVGDSFAVEGGAIQANRVRAAANKQAARDGNKYAVLRLPDGSYRCWRAE